MNVASRVLPAGDDGGGQRQPACAAAGAGAGGRSLAARAGSAGHPAGAVRPRQPGCPVHVPAAEPLISRKLSGFCNGAYSPARMDTGNVVFVLVATMLRASFALHAAVRLIHVLVYMADG